MGHHFHWLKICGVLLGCALLWSGCNPLESKAKAGLQVETGEIKATLFLDDQYLEKTPFINKEIKPGTYTLKIQPDDSALTSYETEVVLRRGLLTVVTWLPGSRAELSGGVIYEMEKSPDRDKSELTVVTIPDSAIVHLQGRDKEFAPFTLTGLEPGEKEYEVSLPSYDTQQHTVNLLPGYRTTITVKLAKSAYLPSAGRAETATTTSVSAQPDTTSSSATNSATRLTSPVATKPMATTTPQTPTSASSTMTLPPPKVVVKATGFFQAGKEVLRVRSSPTAGGETLGYAPVGSEYAYEQESTNGWHKIRFNTQLGWVSGQYVTLIK